MKLKHVALSLALVSCATLPPTQQSTAPPLVSQQTSVTPATTNPVRTEAPLLPRSEKLRNASGKVQSTANSDRLQLAVVIQRPPGTGFKIQQLELSRIQNLRSWVEGPGLETRILNLNNFVAVNDQNQETSLVIEQVPRGKHRVVTVQGYFEAEAPEDPVAMPGATLKAVYNSPENSTEVELVFTWRSTAYADLVETFLQRAEDAQGGEPTSEAILAILDNLDTAAVDTFLDAIIYGNNPPGGNTYDVHPDRLDPDKIVDAILVNGGQIPTYDPQNQSDYLDEMADLNLTVQTPQLVPFSNSQIQVQITDPASDPIVLNIGADTGDVPQIVPGNWEAVVKLDGLNGGVSARATLEVDENGQAILTEGTPQNPIVLPPVIKAIDKTSAGAGDQVTLTGEGFDPDPAGNTVRFGDTVATVISATATELVIEVPTDTSGTPRITVTSQGKTGNFAEIDIEPRFIAQDKFKGDPGDQVTLTVSGYDPSVVNTTVRFNGSAVDVVPDSATANTITVTVPADATSGPLTLKPDGLTELTSQPFAIGDAPVITSIDKPQTIAGDTVVLTGLNLGSANSVTLNGTPVANFSVQTVNGQDLVTVELTNGATSGDITVTTPDGSDSIGVIIVEPPTISNITPPDPNEATPTITLQGQNYLPITQVTIGGVVIPETDYTIDNDGQLRITTVPDNPVLGPVEITNAAGSAVSSLTYNNVVNFLGNTTYGSYEDPYPFTQVRQSRPVPNVENVYTQFVSGHGINVDGNGNIYVADLGDLIHKFTPQGNPVAGWPLGQNLDCDVANCNVDSVIDNDVAGVRFNGPEDLANDADGNIYVADTFNDSIRKITVDQNTGRAISVKTLAKLPGPEGIEISRDGVLYVTGNNPPNPNSTSPIISSYVFKIEDLDTLATPLEIAAYSRTAQNPFTPNVELVAGGARSTTRPQPTPAGGTPPTLQEARFNHLEGLGVDGEGRVYVADVDNYLIRRIDPVRDEVTVFADVDPCFGGVPNCTPTLDSPRITVHEIRVDRRGNVFVPAVSSLQFFGERDFGTPAVGVYVISPEGKFSFIAGDDSVRETGTRGLAGMQDGSPIDGSFFASPRGVDFGLDGTLYVIDTAWGIRKIERYHPVSNLQIP